jgi:hypothetical protein
MSTISRDHRTREPVGAFASLDGAGRATAHLVELGYEPDDVSIGPRDFAPVETPRLGDRIPRAAGHGAIWAGAVVASVAIVATIGLAPVITVVVPATLGAAVLGALIGAVDAIYRHRRSMPLRIPGRPPALRATAFDVRVERSTGEARHDLAQWWDPAAVPAGCDRAP